MQQMIEYQILDGKLRAIEQELKGCEERKRAKVAQNFLTKVDEVAAKLDKKASDLQAKYKDITNVYQQKIKEVQDFTGVADGLEEHKEIDYIAKRVEKTNNEVRMLESEIAELEKEVNAVTTEFSELKRKNRVAIEEYNEYRARYKKLKDSRAGELDAIRRELEAFETKVDAKLLDVYKKRREEKLYPVFVPAISGTEKEEKLCGGCRMPIPLAARNKLNDSKLIECEECHRFIFLE